MDSVFIIHTKSSLFLLCHVFFMEVTFCVCSYEMNFRKLFSPKTAKYRLDGVYLKCFLIENILPEQHSKETKAYSHCQTIMTQWETYSVIVNVSCDTVFYLSWQLSTVKFIFLCIYYWHGSCTQCLVFTLVRWIHDCANYYKIYI